MALCEIRVPTYRRPQWLERALRSILAQDMADWRAIIFDDSPDQEGRDVVRRLADARLIYRPNSVNLRAAANIDQCFGPTPLADGTHACILEDDNWFYPGFLSSNLRALAESAAAICLRNQAVWRQLADKVEPTQQTTIGDLYAEGVYSPAQICARLFLAFGISQGGLFWSLTECRSPLTVGPKVTDSGMSEVCRTLLISQPVVVCAQPQCAFAQMDASLCVRSFQSDRVFGRGLQALRRHAAATYGGSIIAEAETLAQRLGRQRELDTNLLDCFLRLRARHQSLSRGMIQLAKSGVKRIFIASPVDDFLKGLDRRRS
jgi:hypothetical protein